MLYGFKKNSHIYNPQIKEFENLDKAVRYLIIRYKFTAKDRDGDRLWVELWEHDGTERKNMNSNQVHEIMRVEMGHDGDIWVTKRYDVIAKYPYVKTRKGLDGKIIVLPFQNGAKIYLEEELKK